MVDKPRYQRPSRRSGGPRDPFFDLRIPDHAYLFGVIQTDGTHTSGTRNRGRISIELADRDAEVLRPATMRRDYTSRRWTREEDAIVMADRPLDEIARTLDRSYQSVNMRRVRLRARP